jgi:hypothetical protein
MIDKIAVPFWLCLTAGMVAGVATGRAALGLMVGAAAGVLLGLLFVAAAKRRKRQVFCVPLAGAPETVRPATPSSEVQRAA